MSPRNTPPTALEAFYTVREAARKLGFNKPDNPDEELLDEAEDTGTRQAGERWLRDGVNRTPDKGPRFPHHRLGRRLMFSESDLAEIAAMHRNAPTRSGRPRRHRSAA
ncbi:hypothetical protein GCM10009837_06570 [Streptomyces durmitorensis]|uniref:Helix-turn-helix domain-containing protein n=1 Tax=Streptomyces durmitorensis TaxID=319947 RepID=A0ABY4PLF0_9ACTN|nr:helix-turn-helix domain-containing protein [Streptomyces durmitorensis]UQT54446.1 helix-turn-helix domain-containing protein [Streptomyces durmitorensis]